MPCYLLGDVRVLEAVDVPGLEHLVDCVVFPTRGKRPHADEQAGGDLDGDQFFVCWDDRLIPPRIEPASDYAAAAAKREPPVTVKAMLQYFSIQNMAMKVTGLLANLYDKWADAYGPSCSECRWIGMLFGRAIDATKSGEVVKIPDHLRNPPADVIKASIDARTFVWQKMERAAKLFKDDYRAREIESGAILSADYFTEDFVVDLLSDDFTSMTEFQKFRLAYAFSLVVSSGDEDAALEYFTDKFLDKINFSLFASALEKSCAVDVGVPVEIVGNALTRTKIVGQSDMTALNMSGPATHYGLYYYADRSNFDMYMLQRGLTSHSFTQLFIKLPDGVRFIFNFCEPLQLGERKCLPKDTLQAFFISSGFGIRKHLADQCREVMWYDLTDDRFQIYREGGIQDSLLWIRSNDFSLSGKDGDNLKRLTEFRDSISVDLVKSRFAPRDHPRIRKTPFLAVEIFAHTDNVPAYPDILLGNEVDDVPEVDMELCLDDGGPETRDPDAILASILAEDEGIVDEDLLSFVDLKWKLKKAVCATVPWLNEPNEGNKDIVRRLLNMTDFQGRAFRDKSRILVLLSRLNLTSMAEQFATDLKATHPSFQEILQVLGEWKICWYVRPEILVPLVKDLIEELWLDPNCAREVQYLGPLVRNCFVEFLNDLTLCKENVAMGAAQNLRISVATGSRENRERDGSSNGGESGESPVPTSPSSDEGIVRGDDGGGAKAPAETKTVTFHSFSAGSRLSTVPSGGEAVVLARTVDWKGDKTAGCCVEIATVEEMTLVPLFIKVKLDSPLIPDVLVQDMLNPSRTWIVNPLDKANVTLYTRVMAACLRLLSMNGRLFDSIVNYVQLPLENGGVDIDQEDTSVLNPGQKIAVGSALRNHLTLIQGPPGTGKTKVACALLKAMAKSEQFNGKILAVAETNNAVDNIGRRLLDMGVKILRVGNGKFVSGDMFKHTLEGRIRALMAEEGKRVQLRGDGRLIKKKALVKKILEEANVVLSTCAGAGDPDLADISYRFVLVDEATQTKEHTLLCALSHGAEQLVLIGDPRQLGPLVNLETNWSWLEQQDTQQVAAGLGCTLFHKLFDGGLKHYMLNVQYRMHPAIASYPSFKFYDSNLKTGVSKEDRVPPWSSLNPMAFIHVEGSERKIAMSWSNEEEVKTVKRLVDGLVSSLNVPPDNVVVLTLYNAQVRCLKRALGSKILVSSIDGFQGKEAPVIVVSTVRCRGELGFSDDAKRLNVLLTRAKSALVIVGHQDTLEKSDIWKGWLAQPFVSTFDGFEEFKAALMPNADLASGAEAAARVQDRGTVRGRGRGFPRRARAGARGFRGRGRS